MTMGGKIAYKYGAGKTHSLAKEIDAAIDPLLEALQLAQNYIDYVRQKNKRLHEEADGIPSAESAIKQALQAHGAKEGM